MAHVASLGEWRPLVVQCTIDLFLAYDVELAETAVDQRPDIGSLIRFGGHQARGQLALAVTTALLDAPAFAHSPPETWLRELSNQLLGRIKNRLLPTGTVLKMSTPEPLTDPELRQQPLDVGISVRGSHGVAVVWFEIDAQPFAPTDNETCETAVAEGTILTF